MADPNSFQTNSKSGSFDWRENVRVPVDLNLAHCGLTRIHKPINMIRTQRLKLLEVHPVLSGHRR